jgi:hypothetical protein
MPVLLLGRFLCAVERIDLLLGWIGTVVLVRRVPGDSPVKPAVLVRTHPLSATVDEDPNVLVRLLLRRRRTGIRHRRREHPLESAHGSRIMGFGLTLVFRRLAFHRSIAVSRRSWRRWRVSHGCEPELLASRHDILRLPGLGVVETRRVDHARHKTLPDQLSVTGAAVVVAVVVAIDVAIVVAIGVVALVAISVGARRASFAIKAAGPRAHADVLLADGARTGSRFLDHVADFDAGVGVRAVDPAVGCVSRHVVGVLVFELFGGLMKLMCVQEVSK